MRRRSILVPLLLLAGGAALLAAARARRRAERRATDALWERLMRPGCCTPFDRDEVAGLPEPARRYLLHAIAPGAPLAGSVELGMHGALRLRSGAPPLPMRARQLLAPARGFLWHAEVGHGLLRFRGYDAYVDGRGRMRWSLWGVVPVVRADGDGVTRSAAGRAAGEAVFVPSSLLPRYGARWEETDPAEPDTAVVHLEVGEERHSLTLRLDPHGGLVSVSFLRWRGEDGKGRREPFVMDHVTEERTFGGYTIPTRFRAGWQGEPDETPFFFAAIDRARYR